MMVWVAMMHDDAHLIIAFHDRTSDRTPYGSALHGKLVRLMSGFDNMHL